MIYKDKIVFITGASSGIGQACAIAFAALGAKLILSARRVDRLQHLAQDLLKKYETRSWVLPLDVRDRDTVGTQLASLPKDWEAIYLLINNAGLALTTDLIQDADPANWDIMIDTNIKGLLYVSRAILPGMLSRGQGHVINIGSVAGRDSYPAGNVYSATKHAVKAISKSMRLDMLGSPVRVTEIAPGAVETEFSIVRWQDKKRADAFYQDFEPLLAKDVADAVVFAATRPPHVDIAEIVLMPTAQASANHLYRGKK